MTDKLCTFDGASPATEDSGEAAQIVKQFSLCWGANSVASAKHIRPCESHYSPSWRSRTTRAFASFVLGKWTTSSFAIALAIGLCFVEIGVLIGFPEAHAQYAISTRPTTQADVDRRRRADASFVVREAERNGCKLSTSQQYTSLYQYLESDPQRLDKLFTIVVNLDQEAKRRFPWGKLCSGDIDSVISKSAGAVPNSTRENNPAIRRDAATTQAAGAAQSRESAARDQKQASQTQNSENPFRSNQQVPISQNSGNPFRNQQQLGEASKQNHTDRTAIQSAQPASKKPQGSGSGQIAAGAPANVTKSQTSSIPSPGNPFASPCVGAGCAGQASVVGGAGAAPVDSLASASPPIRDSDRKLMPALQASLGKSMLSLLASGMGFFARAADAAGNAMHALNVMKVAQGEFDKKVAEAMPEATNPYDN